MTTEPTGPTGSAEPVDAETSSETPGAETPSETPGAETPRPAERSRPVRLLLTAVLLGPLLGLGIGYEIQAARPATPLPALKLDQLHYPAPTLDAKAAAAAASKPLAIDGDLRKLLISKPNGADDWDDFGYGDQSGWLTLAEKARSRGHSDQVFRRLLSEGFRRDAVASWKQGDVKYRVELIQFTSDEATNAISYAKDPLLSSGSRAIPGTVDGFVSTPAESHTYADSTETFYGGDAVARRGTVVMWISVFAPSQVNSDQLMDLAKQQWERLA